MSLILCIAAFLATLYVSRKSLVSGLAMTIAVGYFYGITRANLNEVMSHFIFDGAVIGLYLGRIMVAQSGSVSAITVLVRPWLIVLIGWPVLLALLPIQDPLIQAVGLRGNMFLIPMFLLGAQMEREERRHLAYYLAILNLVAFVFAVGEFYLGVDQFFPRNEITELIFRSRTDELGKSYRIPATFTGSHAFAGTMVCTIPLLVEAWTGQALSRVRRWIVISGVIVAVLGVFMAASRTHAVVLFFLIIVATLSFQMRPAMLGLWIAIILATGWLVMQDPRLQRFATLSDTELVSSRISGSVNASLVTAIWDYPMGNGIGAGGSSVPYFLANRIQNPMWIENEYARVQLELGLPGLAIWLAFIGWVHLRGLRIAVRHRSMGRRLAYAASAAGFMTGMTGTGLLTSIPQTVLILFFAGWVIRDEATYTATTPEASGIHAPVGYREVEVLQR